MPDNNETEFEKLVREGKLDEARVKQNIISMWNRGNRNQPVKVTPREQPDSQYVRGYITTEKYIRGRTPQQMEKLLGLEPGKLQDGATIYRLKQTPTAEQFEPRGYSQTPGGMPYEPGGKYPPGEGIPQWNLTKDIPAEVIGKVGYEETWKGPSAEQSIASSPLSSDSGNAPSNEAAGPAGGAVGKVAGEAAGKAQQQAVESTGQSTEDPVKANENAAKENASDEEQNSGYGYGY